jgi:flagellar biosynthesis/type III secretory pathway M-ring protein FliF/YscJ
MDLLKTQLERIQKQLAGLNASQKMLVAALAAIMVITVVWWGKYAGEAEMVPLLNQSFSATDLGRIQDKLTNQGIAFTVSGDKLLVPADKRMQILSELTYARLMPHDTAQGFDSIVKEMSPFDSENKQQRIWNHGTEAVLSQIIGSFPSVAAADVLIDPTSTVRIEGNVEPSATVNITLQDGGKPNQRMVDAAADAVAGAVAGMKSSGVKVVINGAAQRVHDSQDPMSSGSDVLELVQQNEAAAEEQVRKNYRDIPNLLVTVKMKLNTTSVHTDKHEVDAKGAVQKAIKSSSETDKTPAAGGGSEPGVMSNVAMSVGNANSAPAGGGQEHEKTEDAFMVVVPDSHIVSQTAAGDATPLSATVRVPMSYITRTYQSRNASTQAPTYAQLKPLIDEQSILMRQHVANCVGLDSPEKVAFDTFADDMPFLSTPPIASTSGPGLSKLVGGHAKEIALGTLAIMSLFMASMMVRKASPAPLPAATAVARAEPDKKKGPFSFAGEDLAGEAASSEGLLDGMELNEETVKAGRMVEQVSSMVRENPDAAAALMKRWLSRT